jgi:uncharacterized protein with PQ loop repeat
MITEIIGWIGVITGIIVSFPQLIKSYKENARKA